MTAHNISECKSQNSARSQTAPTVGMKILRYFFFSASFSASAFSLAAFASALYFS